MYKKQIKTVSSGGNSVVLLNEDRAVQIFKYKDEYQKVIQFILDISKQPFVELSFYIADNSNRILKYSVLDFLSSMKNHNPHLNTIVWNKITCLNELDTKVRITLVTRMIEKLIWDILKTIVGLHRCGYSHGDVSLDNIGFSNGRFVLYDYNMTRKSNHTGMRKDLVSFIRSIRFHLDTHITSRIEELLSFGYTYPLENFVHIIREDLNLDSNDLAIDFLDQLRLESEDQWSQKSD